MATMSSPSFRKRADTCPVVSASDLGRPSRDAQPLAGADQGSQLSSSSPARAPVSSSSSSSKRAYTTEPARAPVSSSSSSKQAYTTEIVKALFGGAVGEVILDCSCSFQRQAGRLYIANKGLYFYSNLFGFEKKVRINYDQVLHVTTLRTTSLSVKTVEGEVSIFRSFDNREHVLEIILGFHTNREEEESHNEDLILASTTTSAAQEVSTISCDHISLDGGANEVESPLPDSPNENTKKNESELDIRSERNDTDKNNIIEGDATTADVDATNAKNEEIMKQWEELKQQVNDWESTVVDLKIACKSVENFFDLFLKDDAKNTMLEFQNKFNGDKNVSISPWKPDNTTSQQRGEKSIVRMIKLVHGVSNANITRRQTYQCFGSHACLRNKTDIRGIRAAPCDAFFVEDIWFLEDCRGNNNINLTVQFHVSWTKKTMLKSIVERRTKAETAQYYQNYSRYVRQKMHQTPPVQKEIVPPAANAKAEVDWVGIIASCIRQFMAYILRMFNENPILILIVILALIIYRLKRRVYALEGWVSELERRLIELEKAQLNLSPELTTELP